MADDLFTGVLGGEEDKSEAAASETPAGSAEAFAAAIAAIASRQDPQVAHDTSIFLKKQARLLDLQARHLEDEHVSRLTHLHLTVAAAKRKRYADRMRNGLYTGIALIVLGVLVAAVRMTVEAVGDHSVVVEEFTVPPDVAARGASGQALADGLVARVAFIRSTARGFERTEQVRADQADALKVEIPETGISLNELESFLHRWLGDQTVVSGEVRDEAGGQIAMIVHIPGAAPIDVEGPITALGPLSQKLAEQVYATVNPTNYDVYLAMQGREVEALQFARRYAHGSGLTALPPAGRAGAYSLLADEEPDPHRALDAALISIDQDPGLILGQRVAGVASADLGHDRAMVQYYRRVLDSRLKDQPPNMRAGYAFSTAEARIVMDRALGDFTALRRDYQAAYRTALPAPLYDRYAESAVTEAALHDEAASREDLARALDTAPAETTIIDTPLTLGPPVTISLQVSSGPILAMARWYVSSAAGDWADAEAAAKDLIAVADARGAAAPSPDFATGFEMRQQTLYRPWLAYAEAMTGDIASATALISQTATDCYLCVRTRARIAAAAGDAAMADHWFAEAVRQAPDLPMAYYEWGQALLARGDLAGAASELSLAHDKGSHFADPLKVWGDVLARQGHWSDALAKYNEALSYAPNWAALRAARDAAASTDRNAAAPPTASAAPHGAARPS